MIFSEKHIDSQKINQLIGKPVQVEWLKPRTSGGPGLFLKRFVDKTGSSEKLQLDSKCNFEKRRNGLLLYTNFSNKRTLIPLPYNDILELKIVRGKEEINPTPLYPMWILMKLGVSILKARYFGLRRHQYSIEQMELSLNTRNYEMDFVANGFLFERQLDFLQSLDLENKLVVMRKQEFLKKRS
ncbi:hypothetical protein [Flagellimonas sp.]|uniref:hypothetical protein n=1 Tax=Flagellimonas sp. TaxID=2058762 RepID=UPI003B59209C